MQFRFRQKIIRHWATGQVERLLVLQVYNVDTMQWIDATSDDIKHYNLHISESPIEVVMGA